MENVDYNVGRILRSLYEGPAPSIKKDTIVIFTSDHGGLSAGANTLSPTNLRGRRCWDRKVGVTSNAPLRAGKGHVYEGGVRVPLFVRWPRVLAPRFDPGSAIMGMDVLPTALDLVGGGAIPNIDGRSFAGVLNGTEDWGDRAVFWHLRNSWPYQTGGSPASAIKQGRYKLIHFLGPELPWRGQPQLDTCAANFGHLALYDLRADPSEAVNLADAEPERAHAMLVALTAWKREHSASDTVFKCPDVPPDKNQEKKECDNRNRNCRICTRKWPCYDAPGAAACTQGECQLPLITPPCYPFHKKFWETLHTVGNMWSYTVS